MRAISRVLVVCLLQGGIIGCAEQRVTLGSSSYYKELSRLQQQEIIDNLDAFIDDPYRIPSRTTFGRGNITSTDGSNLSLAFPFNPIPTNAGTATTSLGQYINTYQIALVPEVRGEALNALRELYRGVVYHGILPNALDVGRIVGTKGRWIYWTLMDGSLRAGDPPIPAEAALVGAGQRYRIFTTNQEAFGKFVLLTLGYAGDGKTVGRLSAPDGGTPYAGSAGTPNDQARPGKPSGSKSLKSRPQSAPTVPSPLKPEFLPPTVPSPFKPEFLPPSLDDLGGRSPLSRNPLGSPPSPGGNDPTVRPNGTF